MEKDTVDAQLADVLTYVQNNAFSSLYATLPPYEGNAERYIPTCRATSYELLKQCPALSHAPKEDIRFTASTFSMSDLDQVCLIPQRRDREWQLVAECIESSKTRTALFAGALLWQLGPFFYQTVRRARTTAALVSPRNLAIARQAIEDTGVTYVCAAPETAMSMYRELEKGGQQDLVHMWHLLTGLDTPLPEPMPYGETVVERHILPGLPLGWSRNGEASIHLSGEYYVSGGDGYISITSLTCEALPLINYRVKGVTMQRISDSEIVLSTI